MPAVSQAQQKLMGAALAVKRGAKPISKKVADIAKSISTKDLKKYAGTKHKGLPEKVKKEGVTEMYAVQNPYSGCQPQDLVTPFNPVHGVPHDVMSPDVVHSVHPDMETATAIAEALCSEMIQYEGVLEEKKGSVIKKLHTAINKLEKQRNEIMKQVMDDPKKSSDHKEKIAHITNKLVDLLSKLESVSKSQKEKEESSKEDKSEVKESIVLENYEAHYSDGIRQMKKFKLPKDALNFAKQLINTNKNLKHIEVFKAGPSFHSTADESSLMSWRGDGSYYDNLSKKKPELLKKKMSI